MQTNRVITGDCIDELQNLPADSVHMCMTSPPYWNLRDYGVDGQLGLEDTADEYVQNIANVMDEIKRVLRPDGSLWLNLGDTYKDKDKQLIPERIAIECQKRGWILRNDVTWLKTNPMPQSVKDRLNDTTEEVFHLVQEKSYHYDLDNIREDHADTSMGRATGYQRGKQKNKYADENSPSQGLHSVDDNAETLHPNGKNPGDVFKIAPHSYPDAHFAVYPPELCEKPIKSSCPEGGIVLDPFAGAGTTLLKAKELGRDYIGIELNPEYADMARARIGLDVNDPSNIRDDDNQNGLEAYQ